MTKKLIDGVFKNFISIFEAIKVSFYMFKYAVLLQKEMPTIQKFHWILSMKKIIQF